MPQKNVLGSQDSESGGMSNNNVYQRPFEKSVSNDNFPNGYGIGQPSTEKEFERIPGVNQSEQDKLRGRERARFASLEASGALGLSQVITNKGIVLDTFGGAFGEGGTKPDLQGGANK